MLPKTGEIWAQVAKVKSLKSIEIEGSVQDAAVMGSLVDLPQLEKFSSWGSTGGCSPEVREFLGALPNLKEIGLPQGEFDMPDELKAQRPDIKYFVTDFPP